MGYLNNPQQAREARQRLDDLAPEFGRDPSEIQVSELITIALARDYETARNIAVDELSCRYNLPFDKIVDRYCLLGTPEQCVERLLPYLEAGVDRVELGFCCTNDQLSDQLEQAASEILPHLDRA
jgi:alkanesulfonate monooxygenase SsuD/methylene tetrahydromethanopterin reductase-like flavin-dependent oxidoreductase (luciferase family)